MGEGKEKVMGEGKEKVMGEGKEKRDRIERNTMKGKKYLEDLT